VAKPSVITDETDARFWATGYRPGHKLDPNDPQDAKMIPVWLDIQAKVKREYDANGGMLVTTYDHPDVAQNLADAHAATTEAAAHLDAASKATDPAVAQQHVAASAAATDTAAQKAQAAAKLQPPTVSPQLAQEASQQAAQQPPSPDAPAHEHVAHAQALAAHKPTPRSILQRETDARWWALGYKPGQKLDPNDPQDAKMIPAWNDIYAKVQAEDAAGKLVLTYNNPVVAQKISDAQAADQAAAAHLDTAAANPQAAPEHISLAAIAAQVSAQSTREAAQLQPPSVSPKIAHQAARQSDPRALLIQATYRAFWQQTHFRPGHQLDPRDPQDARMIPIWLQIYAQLEHAHHAVAPPTGRAQIAQEQAKSAGHRAEEVHRHHRQRRQPVRSTMKPGTVQDFRGQAAQAAHQAGAPFVLTFLHPDGTPDQQTFASRAELDAAYARLADQHDQYKYVAAFDLKADPSAPIHDSVGIPAAEHVETGAADAGSELSPTPDATPPPEQKPSLGKIILIGTAAVVGAGLVMYSVASRKTSHKATTPRRSPKVVVAPLTAALPGVRS
jgi:hypothetical protein